MSDRATGDDSFISFAQVTKAFGDQVIYDDLTLSIRRGEALSIVGGSGTGKSVLLRLLIGLLVPDTGTIRFDGEDVGSMDELALYAVRRRISMMFQSSALFDSLTVGENVAYPLRMQLDLREDEIEHRVAEKLKLVDLEGTEKQMPSRLSGGMKKRVGLARAIATEPEVILFDEPTAGLDPINTRRVSDLIRSIHEDLHITAIVVTHDLPCAYLVSDRIAMLSERRMLTVLPTEKFIASPQREIQDFVGAMATDRHLQTPRITKREP